MNPEQFVDHAKLILALSVPLAMAGVWCLVIGANLLTCWQQRKQAKESIQKPAWYAANCLYYMERYHRTGNKRFLDLADSNKVLFFEEPQVIEKLEPLLGA